MKKQGDVVGQPDNKNQHRSTSKRPLTLFFVLLLILATGIGLFYLYQHILQQQKQAERLLQSRLSVLQDDLTQLKHETGQQQQQLTALQTESNMLRETIDRIDQKPTSLDFDFALAEAEHLLVIAVQRLELDRNAAIALAAIEAADRRISGFNVPGVLTIKKQFTEDINALRAINTVDFAGAALYLADMISYIDNLQLRPSVIQQTELKNTQQDSEKINPKTDHNGSVFGLIWKELKSLIVVKRKDEIVKILPDEQYYIYRYLRLELANARFAVLQRDTANMQESIRMVLSWLARYFDQEDAAVSNLIAALRRMQSLELMPELPDINSSLEAVRALKHSSQPHIMPDQMMDAQ